MQSLLTAHPGADTANAADADGTSALHWAVHRNDAEIAGLLIRAGANVRTENRYGVQPLMLAAGNGSAAIARLLLDAGADAGASLNGETALMVASRSGNVDLVALLADRGANVNAVESWRGQTALMWAASEGHVDVVRLLIKHGANIHERSKVGFTALLFAARQGQIDAAMALLDAGANPDDTLRGVAPNRYRRLGARRGASGRQRIPDCRRQRPLSAGDDVPRTRCGSERGAAGMERTPPGVLGEEGRRGRQQQPGTSGIGLDGEPRVREDPRALRRRC